MGDGVISVIPLNRGRTLLSELPIDCYWLINGVMPPLVEVRAPRHWPIHVAFWADCVEKGGSCDAG